MNFDALSSQFLFSIVATRKFGRSTFERSLIFKFEMLAILKLECSKFKPSPGKLTNFQNFKNSKINIFSEFVQFGKPSKFEKLSNFEISCPFDIPHYSQFCRFSYSPFDINEFRHFIFSIFIFDRSTFERSLIFKFEMLAIL